MNHITLATAVGMLAIAATLVAAVAVSVLLPPAAHAAAVPMTKDPKDNRDDGKKKNSIDIEKSETNFDFKQKLKNNCSGFADCTNAAIENLGGLIPTPTPGP